MDEPRVSWFLRAEGPGLRVPDVSFGDDPVLVGSADDPDVALRLPAAAASPYHLRFTPRDAEMVVEVLGGAADVEILLENSLARLRQVVLTRPAIFQLGTTRLTLTDQPRAGAIAPAAAVGKGEKGTPPLPEPTDDAAAKLLVGSSPVMRRLRDAVRRIAPVGVTTLLLGPTGSGKEVVARVLHAHGARAGKSLVTVNCSAFPETLVESELFGHVRGAFNGAVERKGAFREADGGTLFLDEIGELPLSQQPKLLRALREGEIRPVGADRSRRVDVHVISATNKDLQALVNTGHFREDLYVRLKSLVLTLPSLAERRDDIDDLVRRFASDLKMPESVALEVVAAAKKHPFRGNVGELRSYVASWSASGGEEYFRPLVRPSHAPTDLLDEPWDQAEAAFKRAYFEHLFHRTRGDAPRASVLCGMADNNIRNNWRKLGLLGKGDNESD